MHRRFASATIATIVATFALPASAHFTAAATPHWHAGDGWGVAAVFVLTAAFAWLVRGRR
jgi:hypothetical protein